MTDFPDDSTAAGNYSLETLDTAQTDRARSSFVIDLRRSPRIETRLPASLISERGTVKGLVTNLSRTGLRFEAGKALADLMIANSGRVTEGAGITVEVCFEVPATDAGSLAVIVLARNVYVIQSSSENYQCGLEFKFFAEGEDVLVNYLHERGVAG